MVIDKTSVCIVYYLSMYQKLIPSGFKDCNDFLIFFGDTLRGENGREYLVMIDPFLSASIYDTELKTVEKLTIDVASKLKKTCNVYF